MGLLDALRAKGAEEERDPTRAVLKTVLHRRLVEALTPTKLIVNKKNQKRINENHSKLKRIRECGQYPAAFTMKRRSIIGVSRARCKAPLCPLCMDGRAARHRERFTPVVEAYRDEGVKFSLITVTLPHTAKDKIGTLMTWLFEAMRVFTRSASFKKYMKGYVRGVEVTNRNGNGYHPHAHFFVGGLFWPLPDLIETWRKAVRSVCGRTVTDNGVDVIGIVDVEKGLAEAVGYAVKLAALGEFTHVQIRSLDKAVHGRHIVQSSRAWGRRATELEKERQASEEFAVEMIGLRRVAYVALIRKVKQGDKQSQELALDLLWRLLDDGSYPAACGVLGVNLARWAPNYIARQVPALYRRGA